MKFHTKPLVRTLKSVEVYEISYKTVLAVAETGQSV
jgi:hypothetical protein